MKGVVNVKNKGKKLEFDTRQKGILIGAVVCSAIIGFQIGGKYKELMFSIGLSMISSKNPEIMPMLASAIKEFQ